MYIILVYDVDQSRTNKMLKLCRKYLHWIQNSVFEGELSEVQLNELKYEATKIMEVDYDSLIIFKNRDARWLSKEIIGVEKNATDTLL
jgi:CRISPR-associated protein Cas2